MKIGTRTNYLHVAFNVSRKVFITAEINYNVFLEAEALDIGTKVAQIKAMWPR